VRDEKTGRTKLRRSLHRDANGRLQKQVSLPSIGHALGGGAMHRFVFMTVICCLVCTRTFAQQDHGTPLPDQPAPAGAQSQPATPATNPLQNGIVLVQLLQQKSLVFPDLATNREPFGAAQKFQLAANNSISLSTIGEAILASAFGQLINSPSGYHQGADGYAKRFGADMARSASDNLFGTFLIASALHEDPRFYVKRRLTLKESVRYAAVRLVYTRNDSGEQVINYYGLVGPLASEALANTYYPKSNRGVGSTLTRYASDQGWKFTGNLIRQYWPRINRKLRLTP
jgi:hypothetical protein